MRYFTVGHITWGLTTVLYFHYPLLKSLSAGHFPDGFLDPTDCRFARWIPSFLL
jgi:hypothetical protein